MTSKFCEIFRTGTHTSANGTTKEWKTEDLDVMVKNFQEKNSDVPIVVGHPKTNDPAYGWVENLKRVGNSLFASFKQVAPAFAEAVNSGAYKTRSISVYPDGTIRHIGFLGAKPPAIKGLADFQFEENDETEIYDFSELDDYKFNTTASIFDRIRDFFIEKFGIETADKVITKYSIESLKELEDKDEHEVRAFCEKVQKEINMPQEKVEQLQDFAEELAQKDSMIAKLQQEKAELEANNRKEKHLQFAEKAIEKGNITPAQKEFVCEFMEAAYSSDSQNQDFSEDDENNLTNKFKGFINSLKQVDFSETNNNDAEISAIDFSDPVSVKTAVSECVINAQKAGEKISEVQALQRLKKNM